MFGLSWWLSGKESACNAGDKGDAGSIPGSGWSPGGGHGNPLQYSCLGNLMDRGAWKAMVHGVAKSQIGPKWLSKHWICYNIASVLCFSFLAPGMWDLSSPARDWTLTLCIGRRSLVHWTNRKEAKQRLFWTPVRWYADERACPALPGLPPIFFRYDQNDFRVIPSSWIFLL